MMVGESREAAMPDRPESMSAPQTTSRRGFDELQPGDRVEVEHTVTVGGKHWNTKTVGTVVRTERCREGLHFRRNFDDKVYCDTIFLQRADGELTAVTLDEFTVLRRT